MNKTVKIIGLSIFLLVLGIIAFAYYISKPLPLGQKGIQAERLTDKIQKAINQKAWDSTAAISFTFMGNHHYLWDKKNNLVLVQWSTNKVFYNNQTLEGIAYKDGAKLSGATKIDAIATANKYFNNDSFWLIAPFKLRDSGTTRSLVMQDNHEALMVTYNSGGSTPGDSYVWILDDNYVPTAWRMWVSILPVGGFETSWENYVSFPSGLKIATVRNGLVSLKLENLKTGQSIEEINNGVNPFIDLIKK